MVEGQEAGDLRDSASRLKGWRRVWGRAWGRGGDGHLQLTAPPRPVLRTVPEPRVERPPPVRERRCTERPNTRDVEAEPGPGASGRAPRRGGRAARGTADFSSCPSAGEGTPGGAGAGSGMQRGRGAGAWGPRAESGVGRDSTLLAAMR